MGMDFEDRNWFPGHRERDDLTRKTQRYRTPSTFGTGDAVLDLGSSRTVRVETSRHSQTQVRLQTKQTPGPSPKDRRTKIYHE